LIVITRMRSHAYKGITMIRSQHATKGFSASGRSVRATHNCAMDATGLTIEKHRTSKPEMRQRHERLKDCGARASFSGFMGRFTGCGGHIGHFVAWLRRLS
jgi:hypothetical protein